MEDKNQSFTQKRRAATLDAAGNYIGNHQDVSDAVRKLYNEKVPKCPVCNETYLYTKAAQEVGICARCRGESEKMAKAEEKRKKAEEELARKKEEEAANPTPAQAGEEVKGKKGKKGKKQDSTGESASPAEQSEGEGTPPAPAAESADPQ